jgi:hypothetical protein
MGRTSRLTCLLFSLVLAPIAVSAQTNGPTQNMPLRNTFVTGAETVIDTAGAVNVKADDPSFDLQMSQLKTAKDNLVALAQNDREQEIARDASDLVFLVSACHIQAKDGTDTTTCLAQISRARRRMMGNIRKHKVNDAWVDGDPS